jgi:hypothetical protein
LPLTLGLPSPSHSCLPPKKGIANFGHQLLPAAP